MAIATYVALAEGGCWYPSSCFLALWAHVTCQSRYGSWLKLAPCALIKRVVHGSGARLTDSAGFLSPFSLLVVLVRLAMAIDQDILDAIAYAVTAAMSAQQKTGAKMDNKALGSPPEWNSNQEESGFVEWHIKLKAWLTNHFSRAQRSLNAARDADEVIETDNLDVQHFGSAMP